MKQEKSLERKVETTLPTEHGNFTIYAYTGNDNKEHLALVKGTLASANVLCRVHSECITGEVFGSLRCDCKEQLEKSFQLIEAEGSGVVIYLRQEGRGVGLIEKLKAYRLQYLGKDTVDANLDLGHPADNRDYGIAAEILDDLQVESIKMITNNPDKIAQLEKYGIKVVQRVPIIPHNISSHNSEYLQTKRDRMNHLLD